MEPVLDAPAQAPVSTLPPTREAAWGLGRKSILWLEQLRPPGVQPDTGPSRLELGMTSPQNLDRETQSVYFPQLPWQLSYRTLKTRPHRPLLPTRLHGPRVPRTPGQGRKRERESDRVSSSLLVGALKSEKGMESVGGSWGRFPTAWTVPWGGSLSPVPPTYLPGSGHALPSVCFPLEKDQTNYFTLRCDCLIASQTPIPEHSVFRDPCPAQGMLACLLLAFQAGNGEQMSLEGWR